MAEKDKEPKELEEKKIKKSVKWTYDIGGGKVDFFTEGYADGDKLKVSVSGKEAEVEINDNHGVYASGWAFKEYPAVIIK